MMDRIRTLKEARIRRMDGYRHCSSPGAGFASHGAIPSCDEYGGSGYHLPDPDDTDHSTQSSTQFGGSTFLASLDVD
jgi:hypothetical protein